MKRKHDSKEHENRLTNLLFNKPEDFAEKLKLDDMNDTLEIDQKPAWVDEDDESFGANIIPDCKAKGLYKDTLKRKYESLIGTPSWARLDKNPKDDEEILRTVGHLKKSKSINLKKDFLEMKRFPKINADSKSSRQIISCLEFHPTASVALVGCQNGDVSLYSVGGDVNNKLHSFKLNKFYMLYASCFSPDGTQAYIASKKKHDYCVYDLIKAEPKLFTLPRVIKTTTNFVLSPNGKILAVTDGFDEVYLISADSKELLRSLKHNSNVESMTFNDVSSKLYCYCSQGEVSIWDLSMFRVVKKFFDQGCVTAKCITTSSCGRLLATGSAEGIVNVYETENLTTAETLPIKTISNLRTKITGLRFNAATEILAVTSSMYPNAVKLVHIPSYHVYSNFPSLSANLYQVDSVSFSPNSGFMGLGNNKGCAFLYRLKHYKNY